MRVHIERREPFMKTVDIYFIEDGPTGTYVFHTFFDEETGMLLWRRDEVPEGTRTAVPTLQVTEPMLNALREALYPMAVKADEELVRRLKLEEGRVDTLMKSVVTIAERRI